MTKAKRITSKPMPAERKAITDQLFALTAQVRGAGVDVVINHAQIQVGSEIDDEGFSWPCYRPGALSVTFKFPDEGEATEIE